MFTTSRIDCAMQMYTNKWMIMQNRRLKQNYMHALNGQVKLVTKGLISKCKEMQSYIMMLSKQQIRSVSIIY